RTRPTPTLPWQESPSTVLTRRWERAAHVPSGHHPFHLRTLPARDPAVKPGSQTSTSRRGRDRERRPPLSPNARRRVPAGLQLASPWIDHRPCGISERTTQNGV